MEPIDDELKQGMADGPLIRNGFSDALKKRIGERIEEQVGRKKKQWIPWCSGFSAALIAVALLLSLDWHSSPLAELAADVSSNESMTPKSSLPLLNTTLKADPVHSAVLIGLRKDHSPVGGNQESSTYRTVLLAEEQGDLRKVAEGNGILMPYKTEFIRIVPQNIQSVDATYQKIAVSVATEKNINPVQEKVNSVKQVKLREKLVFAGNQYLSVAQTVQQKDNSKDAAFDYVWVKDVEDLTKSKLPAALAPEEEPHVSLSKLYGQSISSDLQNERGESWTITRKEGQWVPQVASYTGAIGQSQTVAQLREVPLKLPESVVSYDKLSANWSDIRRTKPDAVDAFSSPNGEMVGVVSEKDIVVYPFKSQLIPTPLLSVNLDADESIVMIQWAVDEPFVELWKQRAKLLLGK
ncbi:hypothetical protein [Paenibacillus sp. UNC451MF]|uniref:hypothetical protein n=1 Tax=Paenibacillus sp. UNC451MF TaxID=1449063 RepID=UPI00048A5370|nr:hypothetical protein [Paenibacillus sp. UNC451MF]